MFVFHRSLLSYTACFAGVFALTLITLYVVISRMVKQRSGRKYNELRQEDIDNSEYLPSFLWEDLQEDVSLRETAVETTPFGIVRLVEYIPRTVAFWFLECYRINHPNNSVILYGTARTQIDPHPLVQHVTWCRALESTEHVPKIRFLSGFKTYMHGSFSHLSTGFTIMENPGVALKEFIEKNSRDVKSILYRVLLAVNRMHTNGVVIGNIRPDTVYVSEDNRVVFADLSAAKKSNQTDVLKDISDVVNMRF